MTLPSLKIVASNILETIVSRITIWLIGWLKKNSSEMWQSVGQIVEENKGSGVGEAEVYHYRPIVSVASKSLITSGSQDDPMSRGSQLLPRPKWADEIQPFLQNQISEHTRRAYEIDLKQFFVFMKSAIHLDEVRDLKPEHIIFFRKALEEGRFTGKPSAKATINRKLAVIKSFLNWLKLNHLVSENPAGLVKGYPQTQESALRGLSDDEAGKILKGPNRNKLSGALHSAILHCLLYLGVRKGELVSIRIGDLDRERGLDVIRIRGKGHKIRILPIVPRVKASLDHYLFACKRSLEDKEAPLFMPTKNPRTGIVHKPMSPYAIDYVVSRYAKKAGVLKRITPHSCRATCISHALDRRASHRSVQHLAGWSTPLMIQRYDKRREDLQNSAAYVIDYGAEAAL